MAKTATYNTDSRLEGRPLGPHRHGQRPADDLLRAARRLRARGRADPGGRLRRRSQHLRDDDVPVGLRALQARPGQLSLPHRRHQEDRAGPHRDLHPPALLARDHRAGRADGDAAATEKRVRKALASAQKYSLVANSVKSEISVEPNITVIERT